MAVAGLHNVSSAFGPSFFGDSRPSTRASSLFQMWREIENEHVTSQSYKSSQSIRNNSDTECSSTPKSVAQGSENGEDMSQHSYEHENQGKNNIIIISDSFGDIEWVRVRQIFRGWMNSGSKGHSGKLLGEGECERVRNNGGRRPNRRLCGRQTLLDLLVRAQSERNRELLELAERRPVSEFAHRNRIQALLRGKFLRSERLDVDERPSSRGATELGLLRQRHTVSDLREGFLSRLDSSASTPVNSADEYNCESESPRREGEVTEFQSSSDIESCADGDSSNLQAIKVHVAELEEPVLYNEISDQYVSRALDTEEFTAANESSLESEDVNYITSHEFDFGGNINKEFDTQDASAQVEEFRNSIVETEDNVRRQRNTVGSSGSFDDGRDDTSRSLQEGACESVVEQYDNRIKEHSFDNNNVEEPDQIQESHRDWPSHYLEEVIDSWLDTIYPPDDDRSHRMELRDLFSRRLVSSLLHSSFRESLNQVLQSRVERLGHASGNQELEDASFFPALLEQDQEEINGDRTSFSLSDDDFKRNPFAPSSTLSFAVSHRHSWDEDFQGMNWSHHHSKMRLETEREVINELRIDMARLQQRLDNMQSMLEACMEVQLELQQEVSAALNLSIFSTDEEDSFVDNVLHSGSLWECVRKGICCLCRDSRSDSLLYRCGHMCACSTCADNLVRCKGKCPICSVPAVEAVQAYFIQ